MRQTDRMEWMPDRSDQVRWPLTEMEWTEELFAREVMPRFRDQ
jgi:hypothetical protein